MLTSLSKTMRLVLALVFITTSLPSLGFTPVAIPAFYFVTSGSIYYTDGQGAACQIPYDMLLLAGGDTSKPGLPFYPSLAEVGLTPVGLCTGNKTSLPSGLFFVADGTVYYSNGAGHACSYGNVPATLAPGTLTIFPAFPSDLAVNDGVCAGQGGPNQYPTSPTPAANSYFLTQGGIFFDDGQGAACQVTYDMVLLWGNSNMSDLGLSYYPSLAQASLQNVGLCGGGTTTIPAGSFLTSNGTVYYSNGLGHACSWPYAGGVDTTSLLMFPQFPSDLVQNDGACASSPFADVRAFYSTTCSTDDCALQAAIGSGGALYLPPGIYTITQDITVPSNVTLQGAQGLSTLQGSTTPPPTRCALQESPTSPPTLCLGGATDAAIPVIESALTAGATVITVNNNFKAGDLVVLNNYPSDPAGTDICTPKTAAGVTTCSYTPAFSPQNKRQTRRRELVVVASATPSSITLTNPILNSYPAFDTNCDQEATTLPLSPYAYACLSLVHPISNFAIGGGLNFVGIILQSSFVQNMNLNLGSVQQSTISNGSCYGCSVTVSDFDAQNTNSVVNFHESSQNLTVQGYFQGGTCPPTSECGMVELNQVANATVNVSIGDYINTPSTGTEHGVAFDTNYEETTTGFTDVPNFNVTAVVNSTDSAQPADLVTSGEPSAAQTVNANLQSVGGTNITVGAVLGGTVQASAPTGLMIYASANVTFSGSAYNSFAMNPVQNPRDGTWTNNANITFQQTRFEAPPSTSSPSGLFFNVTNTLTLNDVTIDRSQYPQPNAPPYTFPVAQFANTVSNVTFNNLNVVLPSGQTGACMVNGGVTGTTTIIGTLPVPFTSMCQL